ncbi:hypothetical protein JVU11DRAFT_6962 [Chiua virens]|nr:hypothetical protein JVU11DRAFT_6962 [Chiua virens]
MTLRGHTYLPLSQEQDSVVPAHTPTTRWTTEQSRLLDFVTRHAGLLFVICSQFFFASMNLSVKLLSMLDPPTPTLELITVRMVITLFCCLMYMVANKVEDPFLGPKDVRGLLAIRGVAGFFALFGMYYALNYLSLADATVITFLGPFPTALAAYLLLGETYTKREAIAGVCGLVGVILIARPTFLFGNATALDENITPFERLRAVGSVLISVCGNTATVISVRAIGPRAHPMHLMTFFSFWCTIVGSILMAIKHETVVFPMTWQWIILLLVIGLFGVVAQVLMTMGLRYETATRGSLVGYSQLLFAGVLELVVFGTVPSLMSVVGSVAIIAAQVYVVISKQKPPEETPVALRITSSDDVERRLLSSDSAGPVDKPQADVELVTAATDTQPNA